jgi:hypothetical protein
MIALAVGLLIAVASWVPLWVVEATDPYAMPVVLGLFAFVGSVIALVGMVRLVMRLTRNASAAGKP